MKRAARIKQEMKRRRSNLQLLRSSDRPRPKVAQDHPAVRLANRINEDWCWTTKRVNGHDIRVPVDFNQYGNAVKLADWMATQYWWDSVSDRYNELVAAYANDQISGLHFARHVVHMAVSRLGIS